ncbi:MAG: DUF1559 domain-containing protein, partial [Planctomycetia bacterium]
MNRRRGFTLVEVLVVVGLIGLLLALLLPALQQAREAANRAACAANLKQIGVAINAYVEVHGLYPTSCMASGNLPDGRAYGRDSATTHSLILPHLGTEAVYDNINFDFTSQDSSILRRHGCKSVSFRSRPVSYNTSRRAGFNTGRCIVQDEYQDPRGYS